MMRPPPRRLACALLAIAGCHAPTTAPTRIGSRAARPAPAVWVHRDLWAGAAKGTWELQTYRLVIAGTKADMTLTRALLSEEPADGGTTPVTGWQVFDVVHTTGTARMDGSVLVLNIPAGTDGPHWQTRCPQMAIDVAPADAAWMPTPDADPDIDRFDQGVWSRPPTAYVGLVCHDGRWPFLPEPGLERLSLYDVDFSVSAGTRVIAPGGAVAAIRLTPYTPPIPRRLP